MPSPTTQSTTHTNKRERQSCGAPHGIDQTLFWKDLRHLLLFLAVCVVTGVFGVMFLLMSNPERAMTVYLLIVAGCVFLIGAQLRRKHDR